MSLSTGRCQLTAASKTLDEHWEIAQKAWRDNVREEFAREYWDDLQQRMGSLLAAIDRFDQILIHARNACGEK